LEKHRDDKLKAREAYNALHQQHARLLGALDTAALSLLEMDEQDTTDCTRKLSQ